MIGRRRRTIRTMRRPGRAGEGDREVQGPVRTACRRSDAVTGSHVGEQVSTSGRQDRVVFPMRP